MKSIIFTACIAAIASTVTMSTDNLSRRGNRIRRSWPAEDQRNSIQVDHDDPNTVDIQRSFCPLASSILSCVINSECTQDIDCPHHLNCCENGCGTRACMQPLLYAEEVPTCDNHNCLQQGSECIEENGEIKCQCIRGCPPPGEERICTGNNIIFLSKCFMDLHACIKGISLLQKPCPVPDKTSVNSKNESRIPQVIRHPIPTFARIGDNVIFKCTVNEAPHIIWKRGGFQSEFMQTSRNPRISVSNNSRNLIINNVQESDYGVYKCIAINKMGSISLTFNLFIQGQNSEGKELDQNSYENRCAIDPRDQAARCSDPDRPYQRYWSFNNNLNMCELKTFKDCAAILNKYSTNEMCIRSCKSICELPVDNGGCTSFKVRFFYNPESKNCESFVYGGCGGNENNFFLMSDCERSCPYPTAGVVPLTHTCPFCSKNIPRIFCSADFVVTGMIRQLELQSDMQFIKMQLTGIYKDRDNNFGFHAIDFSDPVISNQRFSIELDANCPCPNFNTLLLSKHVVRNVEKSPRHCLGTRERVPNSETISRRTASHEPCAEIIISGKVVNGIPTITQGSLAILAKKTNLRRLNGTIAAPRGFCALVTNQ